MKTVKGIEGYIKFDCRWIKGQPVTAVKIKKLNIWRSKLHKLGLVGAYKDGIGFGNLSQRLGKGNKFIITGSKAGNYKSLMPKHYTRVVGYDFGKNSLICRGPIKASSESLSHAAVYESNKKIKCVIHVHSLSLWKKLKGQVPATSPKASYGTPEIAKEIRKIVQKENEASGIIRMAGHREGILAFGPDADSAGNKIINFL